MEHVNINGINVIVNDEDIENFNDCEINGENSFEEKTILTTVFINKMKVILSKKDLQKSIKVLEKAVKK